MTEFTKSKLKRIIITTAIILIATAGVIFWRKGFSLPSWISWEEKELSYQGAVLQLKDKTLVIIDDSYDKKILWESEKDFLVSDVLTADIDRDGREEFMFLFWKRGYYGRYKPFWVKKDTSDFTQHIFIYRIEDGKVIPVWRASKMGVKVRDWSISENNALKITSEKGEETLWIWNEWGLERIK